MVHVVVNNVSPRISYSPTTGTSYTIPSTWGFFASSDITVYSGTTAFSFAASPTSSTQFATSGSAVDGGFQGGNIVLGAASTGNTITLVLDVPVERATDFPYPAGSVSIEDLNTDLDRGYVLMQQFVRDIARTVAMVDSDTGTLGTLPATTARASRFLSFDSTGGVTTQALSLSGTTATIAAFMTTFLNSSNAATAQTNLSLGTLASTDQITASTQLADAVVTYAKIQDVTAASRLLGRGSTGGAGDVQEISLGTGLSMSGTTITATATQNIKQIQTQSTGAAAVIATVIPFDDTIPQNTEGAEIVSVSLTPGSASNRIYIWGEVFGNNANSNRNTLALFSDQHGTTALAASAFYGTNDNPLPGVVMHDMSAGTTASITFSLRVGPEASTQAARVNTAGASTGRVYGGASATRIMAMEYST